MFKQAGEGAEVDHGVSVARTAAHIVSRTTRLAVSGFLTYCSAAGPRSVPFDHVSA